MTNRLCHRVFRMPLVLTVLTLFAPALVAGEEKPSAPPKTFNDLPLVFHDDFSTGQAEHWEPTDSDAWRVVKQNDNYVYNLFVRKSDYQPPHRSPHNISLIRDIAVGNFVLDVKLQSTLDTGAHRDLCLFFGFQDPAHFYYVHLGRRTDDHANQIFIVNDAPRTKISTKTTEGTPWTDGWHHARVIRDVETGRIEVYFDDMDEPAMTAEDKTFTWGRVGVGSFDDPGNFDDVRLYGEKVEPQQEK